MSITEDNILVDNKLYSVDSIAKMHPGGSLFIELFAGKDATNAFISYHRKEFPHDKYSELLSETFIENNAINNSDYFELCSLVEKIIPKHKSFAPSHYYIKASIILAVAFGLEFYMHYFIFYKWYLSALLGLFYAFIGLNIQHDANHGAISKNPYINYILGLSQNWIGGSAISWKHQHVVQHHVYTNDTELDPDISGTTLLRLNPMRVYNNWYQFQYIYFFILIGLYGWTATFSFLYDVIYGINYTKMSKYVIHQRVFDLSCILLYFIRWYVIPVYQTNTFYTLIEISPMGLVAGYYLGFFFILSHNFKGTKFSTIDENNSFLYQQVSSSCNVGGPILCFFNGGLNYQIEHHLFPKMNHSHYPKVAPIVKEYCLSKNIPYRHYNTVMENLYDTISHLHTMGIC